MARKKKAQGLGDTVENVLETTGIAKVVKSVLDENCGCEARKEKLNKLFPYKKTECLTDEDSEWLSNFFLTNNNQLTPKQQNRIIDIYQNVFNQNIQPSNCGSCWRDRINELRKVYETQNK